LGSGQWPMGLLHDGAMGFQLRNDDVEAGSFRGGAGFAVGSVVAKPNGV